MAGQTIDQIFENNAAVREELRAFLGSIASEDEFRVPEGETWSAAHILEHLSLTEEGMGKICSLLLRGAARKDGAEPELSEKFVNSVTDFQSVKVKTPPTGEPTGTIAIAESLEKMDANRAKLNEKRHRFVENDPSAATFPHPYLGDMTALEWLALIGYHEKRHLEQMKRVLGRA